LPGQGAHIHPFVLRPTPHRDEVSGARPRRIPSAKWRELIKKVWEADPLLCPKCAREMRIVALIDDRAVIERILRHLGLNARCLDARCQTE